MNGKTKRAKRKWAARNYERKIETAKTVLNYPDTDQDNELAHLLAIRQQINNTQ